MALFSTIATGVAAYLGGGLLASVVGYAVAGVSALALSKVLAPKIKPNLNSNVSQTPQEIKATITQDTAPRRVFLGKNMVGGVVCFYDAKDGILFKLFLLNHGEIASLDEVWVDGNRHTKQPDGSFTGIYTITDNFSDTSQNINNSNVIRIDYRLGGDLGGDYPVLTEKFPRWDSTRKLTGQATALVTMRAPKSEDFLNVLPKGQETRFQFVVRGSKVYDPRIGQTIYSDNAALCIAHYLTHPDGWNLPPNKIDWDWVSAMADYCDEIVPSPHEGDIPRLRLAAYWTLDEQPVDVINRFYSATGIRPFELATGKIGLIGGSFGTASETIETEDIISIETIEAISEREGYNVIRPVYTDPKRNWGQVEATAWRDEDKLAEEGEISESMDISASCSSLSQARRIAKRRYMQDNRAKVMLVTNTNGLRVREPSELGKRHIVNLDYRPDDGSGRVVVGEYEVINHSIEITGLTCQIELAKVNRAEDEWSAFEEGNSIVQIENSENLPPELEISVTLEHQNVSAISATSYLQVVGVPIAERGDLSIEAEYKKISSSVWVSMTNAGGYATVSNVLEDNAEYEVRARWRGAFYGSAPWVYSNPVVAVVAAAQPSPAKNLSGSFSGSDAVQLSWENPDQIFYRANIYRSTTDDFSTANYIGQTGGASGQVSFYSDATFAASATYYYWVTVLGISLVESDPTTSISITT